MHSATWFASIPVVGSRELYDTEKEQFADFVRGLRSEAAVSYLFLFISVVVAIVAANLNINADWRNLVVFSVAMGLLRYLPHRRFISPAALFRLHRDATDGTVWLCWSGDVSIEVLRNSHFVWRRDGIPVVSAVRVREARTAVPPPHAAMAANFVKPLPSNEDILVHQRALSEDERIELDAHVPPPSSFVTSIAIISADGAVWSYVQVAYGASQTLLPALGLSVMCLWTGRATYRRYVARKRLERDIEDRLVLIVRTYNGEATTAPKEFLAASGLPWAENGVPASWRTQ